MRFLGFMVLIVLVLLSFGVLLLTWSYAASLSCLSRLEAGERGVVPRMLESGMAGELESYHLRHIRAAGINLPAAPAYAPGLAHPSAERFFYVDAQGNVTIKGLSDENVPQDLSQKCLLFVDTGLTWFKTQLLLDALLSENIRYIHVAGMTTGGQLAYTVLEITAPGCFPMLYPHRICLLNDDEACYYYEDEETITDYADLAGFKDAVKEMRELSVAERPFLRLLVMGNVTCASVYRTLTMFEPAGVQALVKLRSDDHEWILATVTELKNRLQRKEGK